MLKPSNWTASAPWTIETLAICWMGWLGGVSNMMVAPAWVCSYGFLFDVCLCYLDVSVRRRLIPSRRSRWACGFRVGVFFNPIKKEQLLFLLYSLLESLYRLLHLFGRLDVGQCFEVNERPYLGLNQLCFKYLEHAMKLLIAKNEFVIFGDSLLWGWGFIREEKELFE